MKYFCKIILLIHLIGQNNYTRWYIKSYLLKDRYGTADEGIALRKITGIINI